MLIIPPLVVVAGGLAWVLTCAILFALSGGPPTSS